jgi:hypothetical protein
MPAAGPATSDASRPNPGQGDPDDPFPAGRGNAGRRVSGRRAGRAFLSRQTDHLADPLSARRQRGHAGAAPGRGIAEEVGPARGAGIQAGRGRHDRVGAAGARQARRLHAADGAGRPCDQSQPVSVAALRHAPRFRAGVAGGHAADAGGGPLEHAGRYRGRTDRLRQEPPRQAQLRVGGQRQHQPPRRRDVQEPDRRRHDARALQRQRAGRGGAPGRRSVVDVRQHLHVAAASAGGKAEGHRRDGGAALCLAARRAHGGRKRAGVRGERLVRRARRRTSSMR